MKNMQEQFPEVILNEDLYKYSTFQIGGPADYFFKLKRSSDLKPLIIKSDRSDTLSKYLDRSIISPNAYALLPDTLSHDLIKISKNDFDWYIRK